MSARHERPRRRRRPLRQVEIDVHALDVPFGGHGTLRPVLTMLVDVQTREILSWGLMPPPMNPD